MRASAVSGGALARRELAQGRIERVLFRVSDLLGRIGAIAVAPILELLANLLEFVEKKIAPTLSLVGLAILGTIKLFGQFLQRIPGFMAYGLGAEAWAVDMIKALNRLGTNTDPIYQGNAPFIADLRLMGAKI
jgi:hypothetical protein